MSINGIAKKQNTSKILKTSKYCFSGINSIIEENVRIKEAEKKTNPLKSSIEARINHLQQALYQAVILNNRLRNAYRSFRNKLSGMIKITANQRANLISKKIAYGESDMNEDLLRSTLMDVLHSQSINYNC